MPIALADICVAPFFTVEVSDLSIFIISILPYCSMNSSTLMYPPPTLMTNLELIILARIYFYPNIYFPSPNLDTTTLHPFFTIAAPNIASISSPLTNLYFTTSVAKLIISRTYALCSRICVRMNFRFRHSSLSLAIFCL